MKNIHACGHTDFQCLFCSENGVEVHKDKRLLPISCLTLLVQKPEMYMPGVLVGPVCFLYSLHQHFLGLRMGKAVLGRGSELGMMLFSQSVGHCISAFPG